MPSLSNSQIDRLGQRLCNGGQPAAADLFLLEELLAEYAGALQVTEERLRTLGLVPHGRLKTSGTLRDKLQREKVTLRGIRDLAGTRIVKRMNLAQQDALCDQICGLFDDPKVIDRRTAPMHGYRAVHIVPKVGGKRVEIQVRTLWQDTWAQMFEALADSVGRQIRYGQPPATPDAPAGSTTRAGLVQSLLDLSATIPTYEDLEDITTKAANLQLKNSAQLLKAKELLDGFRETMNQTRANLGLPDLPPDV